MVPPVVVWFVQNLPRLAVWVSCGSNFFVTSEAFGPEMPNLRLCALTLTHLTEPVLAAFLQNSFKAKLTVGICSY